MAKRYAVKPKHTLNMRRFFNTGEMRWHITGGQRYTLSDHRITSRISGMLAKTSRNRVSRKKIKMKVVRPNITALREFYGI